MRVVCTDVQGGWRLNGCGYRRSFLAWMVCPDFNSRLWLAGALWDWESQTVFKDVSYKIDIGV